jgi:phospholipase D1/2
VQELNPALGLQWQYFCWLDGMSVEPHLSPRAYQASLPAYSWEEIFDAGPYYERIAELLEDAEHYAIFVGWQIDSRLPFPRPFRPGRPFGLECLKEKILRIVTEKPDFHFYFLMWDHAYFYVFERQGWQGRVWDHIHPNVHFIFDNRHPFGGSHHEKICIIDGKTALSGGIDLCDERWDTPHHFFHDPRRSLLRKIENHGPYHDIAVQVTGPICGEIQNHIRDRWEAISCIPFPKAPTFSHSSQAHEVYLSRTFASVDGRKPVTREIEFLFRDLIRSAEKRILLEGQYYWSKEVNDLLIAKLVEKAGTGFELIVVLADIRKLKSLTKRMSFYELQLLQELELAARTTGARLTLGSPYVFPPLPNTGESPKPVYIHSKLIVVDDRYLSIGSANLATRALRLDTEINLTLEAKTEAERLHISRFSERALRHWSHDDVRLIPIHPMRESSERIRNLSPANRFLQKHIPWKFFFDPPRPWFYPLARSFRKKMRHFASIKNLFVIASIVLITALITSGFAELVSGEAAPYLWTGLFSLILGSVWFVPIPFIALSLLATYRLGPQMGPLVTLFSFWSSSFIGYFLTRVFPVTSERFLHQTAPVWLPKQLKLRSFMTTLFTLADPRLGIRSKIAYSGLYCVPLPWFLLSMIVVLPLGLFTALKLLHHFSSPDFSAEMSHYAPALFLLFAVYGGLRLVVRR